MFVEGIVTIRCRSINITSRESLVCLFIMYSSNAFGDLHVCYDLNKSPATYANTTFKIANVRSRSKRILLRNFWRVNNCLVFFFREHFSCINNFECCKRVYYLFRDAFAVYFMNKLKALSFIYSVVKVNLHYLSILGYEVMIAYNHHMNLNIIET